MQLTVEQDYPASVDAVAAMLLDEKYIEWRATHTIGGGRVEQVTVDRYPDGTTTAIVRRTLPTDLIPTQARALIGDCVEVRQAEVWEPLASDRMPGTVAVEIVGAPVRITGTVELVGTAAGSRVTYSGNVTASIPLFGHLVEETAGRILRRTLESEAEAGCQWLSDNAPTKEATNG